MWINLSWVPRCNYQLDQISQRQDAPTVDLPDVVPLSIETIETLRSVNSMVEAQLIWSMENIQTGQFPIVMQAIDRLRTQYPR